jgi:oxamate amidohydrolase
MPHPNGPWTGRPSTLAPRGLVSTSHYLASASGLRRLQEGGSAADAAIAANAVLAVVYPHMAGLGGDGFWLVHEPGAQSPKALNASGPAAQMATRDFYREQGHTDEIPSRGPLAALTVPGAIDGWREIHERYGRLEWSRLFDDAIRYARDGAPVGRSLSDWLVEDYDILQEHPSAGRIFTPGDAPAREGDMLRQPDLAGSLERIASQGAREAFYDGELAERISDALTKAGSPLRADDFAAFRSEWIEPISATYRDATIYEFPPNTQGFAALQILNLLEAFDVQAWGDGTADYFHHMAEAVKVSFADRDACLTDPAFVDIPVDRLISKEYAHERRALIDPSHALEMESVEPGIPFETQAVRRSPGGDTCYFCVVDEDGLALSIIQSIYHDFGSAEVAGDTGVLLQNRGSFFSLDDDHPNRLEPGKRTFHTLIPGLMYRDGELDLIFGAMGGEGQPQTHAALVTRVLDFGYGVQQAIEAPRWLMGRTWGTQDRDLSLEGRISNESARELERRGQPIKMLTAWNDNMGHAQAIRIDRGSGLLEGGADPRGDGAALGI